MSKSRFPWSPEMNAAPVELMVHSIFVIPTKDKDDNTVYRFYMSAKQRRDVAAFSPTAGDFVTNISMHKQNGDDKKEFNVHSVPIGRQLFQQILDWSGYDGIDDKYIQMAATQHRPLVNSQDGLYFQAEVTDDKVHSGYKGLPNYRLIKKTIKKSDYPFDWNRYEGVWEQRAQSTVDSLNKLLELNPDEYFKFKGRPDFPKGQYEDLPEDKNSSFNAPA